MTYGIKLAICGFVVVAFAVFQIIPERELGGFPLLLKGVTEFLIPFAGIYLLVLLYPKLTPEKNDPPQSKK
jgi:hypothetical protein